MAAMEVRFRKLVDKAGRPQIVSLWTNPKRDRGFMKAVKEGRVLTIIQEPRSHKKDFGRPGFHQDPHASYLVFPKPIAVSPESRVIGISYELAVEPRVRDPLPKGSRVAHSPKAGPGRTAKAFNVIVKRTAVIETSVEVQARSMAEARGKALSSVKMEPFDGSKAVIKNELR